MLQVQKLSRQDSHLSMTDRGDVLLRTMKHLDKKLIFVPVLLISIRIWGTIRYFLILAGDMPSVDLLAILQVHMCWLLPLGRE